MNLACPTCGSEVSFRFDDSLVRVCPHCNAAVVRTDRGAETLGQFGDLARVQSPLKLFAEGVWGVQSFILVGMAQLRHESGGIWQEWYAKLGAGVWGWLTEAQGRLYMTFERQDLRAPSWDSLAPGAQMTIDQRPFFVIERSEGQYISAVGEIPYRLVPDTEVHTVDLSDGQGGFATIDFNDGSEAPIVYVGQQVALDQLRITGGEERHAGAARQGGALTCPDCGGALELRMPDASLSVACPYCCNLVDVSSGKLSILAQQKKRSIAFPIALGSEGTFPEGKFTVIGYVQRSACIDGSWYPFEEYLLHSPTVGYRWLQCSDNHWNYVQPVAAGAVTEDIGPPKYDGVRFVPYQRSVLRVDYVVGEFYWRVEIGERVEAADFIAPPALLSKEWTESELNWSLSTYMTADEVKKAFGTKLLLGTPQGIGPNQPYPGHVGKVIGFFTVALLAAGVVKCSTTENAIRHTEVFKIPVGTPPATPPPTPTVTPTIDPTAPPSGPTGTPAPATTGDPGGHIIFSKTFKLDDHNIEIHTTANLTNNWAYLAIDLVNEKTGELVSFDQSLEYYSGVEGGESWSEGSSDGSEVLKPLGAGDYLLRIEAQQGGQQPIMAAIEVRQNVFRSRWLFVALGILFIPYGIVLMHASSFKKRRMENSNVGVHD